MSAHILISFTSSALSDLEDILDFYKEQHAPHTGEKLVAQVLQNIEPLDSQPDMGRVVPEFELKYLRELIRPPFRIVYRRDPNKVRVIRIWKSERLLVLP